MSHFLYGRRLLGTNRAVLVGDGEIKVIPQGARLGLELGWPKSDVELTQFAKLALVF